MGSPSWVELVPWYRLDRNEGFPCLVFSKFLQDEVTLFRVESAVDSIAIEGILGDESPVPSTTGFPGHNRRQLHGNGLDQHTKGTMSDSLCELTGATSPMDGNPHRAPGYEIPPVTIECPSGPPQPPEPNAGYRVVSPPAGSIDFHPYRGSPTIDLFATYRNAKLPLYCPLIPDPQAVFENAVSGTWYTLHG